MNICRDDLSGRETQALIRLHLAGMNANSPSGHDFSLDMSALKAPGVTVWSAWEHKTILGIGAMLKIDSATGEVKSMRTHPHHLRKGVGGAILEHIIAQARKTGLQQLSLETGIGPAFEPALQLYRKRGFLEGPAFAGYAHSDFSRFLHLQLS